MKKINKALYIFLIVVLSLGLVCSVSFGKASSETTDGVKVKKKSVHVLPASDDEVSMEMPALDSAIDGISGVYYFEAAPTGLFLDKFDIINDVITGWEIARYRDVGVDIWGQVISGYLVWSTQDHSRFAGNGNVQWIGPAAAVCNYTYTNAWGAAGSGTTALATSYNPHSCFYESFFDGVADNWIDDGSLTWGIPYISDPGNYIDNRVYETTGTGVITPSGQRESYYNYAYSYDPGFTYNADMRRFNENNLACGLVYFHDGIPYNNGYYARITTDTASGNGYYTLQKFVNGAWSSLIPWTQSSVVIGNLGEWNNVKIATRAGTHSLYINDTFVGSAYDTTFTFGLVGVETADWSGVDTVQFDNATLHRDTAKVVPVTAPAPDLEIPSGDPGRPF